MNRINKAGLIVLIIVGMFLVLGANEAFADDTRDLTMKEKWSRARDLMVAAGYKIVTRVEGEPVKQYVPGEHWVTMSPEEAAKLPSGSMDKVEHVAGNIYKVTFSPFTPPAHVLARLSRIPGVEPEDIRAVYRIVPYRSKERPVTNRGAATSPIDQEEDIIAEPAPEQAESDEATASIRTPTGYPKTLNVPFAIARKEVEAQRAARRAVMEASKASLAVTQAVSQVYSVPRTEEIEAYRKELKALPKARPGYSSPRQEAREVTAQRAARWAVREVTPARRAVREVTPARQAEMEASKEELMGKHTGPQAISAKAFSARKTAPVKNVFSEIIKRSTPVQNLSKQPIRTPDIQNKYQPPERKAVNRFLRRP